MDRVKANFIRKLSFVTFINKRYIIQLKYLRSRMGLHLSQSLTMLLKAFKINSNFSWNSNVILKFT